MTLYLVDNIQSQVDPEFDAALFVDAPDEHAAAKAWARYYDQGYTVARVTSVPPITPCTLEGVIEWSDVQQRIVVI